MKNCNLIIVAFIFSFSTHMVLGLENASAKKIDFNLPQKFKSKFVQSFQSVLGNKKKVSHGEIKYMYPGHLYFEITSPKEEIFTFVSNDKQSWRYRPPFSEKEKGQVNIGRPDYILTKFFDILRNGLKTNRFYSVSKKNEIFILEFKEKTAKELNINKAQLKFKNSQKPDFSNIAHIELFYPNKKPVLLELDHVDTNSKIVASDFVFNVPSNTEIAP